MDDKEHDSPSGSHPLSEQRAAGESAPMAPNADYNNIESPETCPPCSGMQPSEFLKELWGDLPPGMVHIFVLPGSTSYWYSKFDDINRDLDRLAHREVYAGVALSAMDGRPFTSHNRVVVADAAAIPGLWADIDVAHPVHKEQKLPATAEQAREVMAQLPFVPTIVVDSGHGLQYWWLFQEPWVFASPDEHEQACRVTQWWHRMVKELFQAQGLTIDSVFDLARVMRVPGTFNNKASGDRKPVEAVKVDGPRYVIGDFLGLVPEDFVASTPGNKRNRTGGPPEGNKGRQSKVPAAAPNRLVLDPGAKPAQMLLETLLEEDARFRATWEMQRPDLSDQSPSGYDMALANSAVRAGWTDQEVKNLLIAFRRRHGLDLKLREDYYTRTIEKAKEPYPNLPSDNGRAKDDPAAAGNGPSAQDDPAAAGNGPSAQDDPSPEGGPPDDLAYLLGKVKLLIPGCGDPEIFRLMDEVRLLARAGADEHSAGKRAAANIQAHFAGYAHHQDLQHIEDLVTAVKAAMDPATQVPTLVERAVKALAGNEKSADALSELMGMLRRQQALDGNHARLINLAEAAELPFPRSVLKARGMSGSILDAGEVSVLSGMGGVGKSTVTLGWAMDLAVLGPGNRGNVGGVFEGEGGTVLMVSYEEKAAVMGRKSLRWARHLDEGDPNGRYHASRNQVLHLGMRNPLFGPDPYRPLYNARPAVLDGWDEVLKAAEKTRPILIVIDPALCAYVADASNSAAVSEFLMVMRDLAVRFDCGVIVVTHSTKAARKSGGKKGQEAADPGQVLGAGAWTDRTRSAMTLTTGSDGRPQLTVAKANLGPQRICISLDQVLDQKDRLLGYKVDDETVWKPLGQQSSRSAGGSGSATGNSEGHSNNKQTKRLFED